MRDEKRIEPFLQRFGYLWSFYPDYRFGQLVTMLQNRTTYDDIFYCEEDIWSKIIEQEIKIAEGRRVEI